MDSKLKLAAVFALLFVLIFSVISLFVPRAIQYRCTGEKMTQYTIIGIRIGSDKSCPDGEVKNTIGFPFSSRQKTYAPSEPGLPSSAPSSLGFKVNTSGLIANAVVYWIFGFLFFLVFSPLKRNRQNNGWRNGSRSRTYR